MFQVRGTAIERVSLERESARLRMSRSDVGNEAALEAFQRRRRSNQGELVCPETLTTRRPSTTRTPQRATRWLPNITGKGDHAKGP